MENTFTGVELLPDNEAQRLAALHRYRLVGTAPEKEFNYIAEMAAQLFKVPIALVNLVDEHDVWTKAGVGLPYDNRVPRGTSLCSLAVLNPDPTVFQNALQEPCLLSNPLVAGDFGLRFYAAAPIRTPDGYNLGAVCLVDHQPRTFNQDEQKVLEGLARIVMDEIERRYGDGRS